jgi:outer membrane receptor protein involved in Fe transport
MLGGNKSKVESTTTVDRGITNPILDNEVEQDNDRLYIYTYFSLNDNVDLTLGGSYLRFKETQAPKITLPNGFEVNPPSTETKENQFNPKLGIIWNASPVTTLRLSAFRNARGSTELETLEPTQIAGFNQVFDDFSSKVIVDSKRYGLAIDQTITPKLFVGASISHANLTSSALSIDDATSTVSTKLFDTKRNFLEAYAYYFPSDKFNIKLDLDYEDYSEPRDAIGPNILSLETLRLPIGIKFRHMKLLTFELTGTYYNQTGDYLLTNLSEVTGKDSFWLFDGVITYHLPRRLGKISVGVKNIFEETFNFEDRLNNTVVLSEKQSTNLIELSEERLFYGKFTVTF